MFKKDTFEEGGAQDTIIAHGVRVEGEFESQGNIIIEGEVHGTVKTERDLKIGENARVVANIVAENAVVSGEVQGNVKIHERLELLPSSRITGDINAKIVTMAPGAILNGKFSMPGGPSEAAERVPEKKRGRSKNQASTAEIEVEEAPTV